MAKELLCMRCGIYTDHLVLVSYAFNENFYSTSATCDDRILYEYTACDSCLQWTIDQIALPYSAANKSWTISSISQDCLKPKTPSTSENDDEEDDAFVMVDRGDSDDYDDDVDYDDL